MVHSYAKKYLEHKNDRECWIGLKNRHDKPQDFEFARELIKAKANDCVLAKCGIGESSLDSAL